MMRNYRIIKEEDPNGNHEYTIWWHMPMFWNKDRWVIESTFKGKGCYVPVRFHTLQEAQFYLNDRYGDRTKTIVAEGVV